MYNPVDDATTQAMIEYKQQQMGKQRGFRSFRREVAPSNRLVEGLRAVRVAAGLRLIRAGARLAGIRPVPPIGAQP